MKIYIQTKGRYKEISTHKYLEDGTYKIVVHDKSEKKRYLKNKTIPPESVVVSGQPHNLALQRSWIKDNLVREKDRWFILMDDNINGFTIVPEKLYYEDVLPEKLSSKIKLTIERTALPFSDIEQYVKETVKYAEKIGTGFVGFAKGQNYFFRRRKYSKVAIICHKFCVIKNDSLRWPEKINFNNDSNYTAMALRKYGRVLMNNYIYPIAEHNEPGGLGTFVERAPEVARCARIIMKKYPGLFRYNTFNPKWTKDGEQLLKKYIDTTLLSLRVHTEEAYRKWKENN